MAQWFLLHQDAVTGPFSEDQVKSDLKAGRIKGNWLIWGRILEHWRTVSWWESELPILLKRTKETKDNRLWHYASDGSTVGPLSRSQLVQELSNHKNKNDVLVWTKGMPSWGHIYEFPDLMDEIGVSRRQHPRAAIKGSVVVKTADKALLGKIVMISAGGCGITGVEGIFSGEKVSLDIKSPSFAEPVRARAEVRYVTETGFVGLKFEQITSEAQGRIIEYVRNSGGQKAAA